MAIGSGSGFTSLVLSGGGSIRRSPTFSLGTDGGASMREKTMGGASTPEPGPRTGGRAKRQSASCLH